MVELVGIFILTLGLSVGVYLLIFTHYHWMDNYKDETDKHNMYNENYKWYYLFKKSRDKE